MAAEVDPKRTVLAGLLGARGFSVRDLAKAAGLSWNGTSMIVHGRTIDPDPDTLRKLTLGVNKLFGTRFSAQEVLVRTKDRITTDAKRIERGLRGWGAVD